MTEEMISCPKCGAPIPLSAAIQGRIEKKVRAEYSEDLEKRLAEERTKAADKVREEYATEQADTKQALMEKTEQVEAGRKRELELLKKTRQLEEAKVELDLEVERRVRAEKTRVEETLTAQLLEEHRLKDAEKEKQLGDLRTQIEELKRKAQQGSQQSQGEVAELNLEGFLHEAFPEDDVAPVPKGIKGADVVQRVIERGRAYGQIVWEVKNTKSWSDTWLAKVRDDQRALKADLAVIASRVVPDEVKPFGHTGSVWVTEYETIHGLAAALRQQLIQVAHSRAAAEGRNSNKDLLYDYLTGTEFRQRVQAMAEAFAGMKEDLEQERRAMEKQWAKREKQLQRALYVGLAGMYGDMQGIMGKSLPEVPQLALGPAKEAEEGAEAAPAPPSV